jgi:hypothetical protein
MAFTSSLPVTTTSSFRSPDGKFDVIVNTTTATTTEVVITPVVSVLAAFVASPDLTAIVSDGGHTIIDIKGNKWTVTKGVISENGTPLAHTSNVVKLVIVKGVIWQQNTGGRWWHWDGVNAIWVGGTAPI